MDIQVKRDQVNLDALHSRLSSDFSAVFKGVSCDGTQVILHFDDGVTSTQIASATLLVESHDPTLLTPEQAAEKARAELLTQMRQERQPLDPEKLGATANDIKALGRRIALLELEIDALRAR